MLQLTRVEGHVPYLMTELVIQDSLNVLDKLIAPIEVKDGDLLLPLEHVTQAIDLERGFLLGEVKLGYVLGRLGEIDNLL